MMGMRSSGDPRRSPSSSSGAGAGCRRTLGGGWGGCCWPHAKGTAHIVRPRIAHASVVGAVFMLAPTLRNTGTETIRQNPDTPWGVYLREQGHRVPPGGTLV